MTIEVADRRRSEAVADLPAVLLAALDQTRAATCITTAELDRPGPEIVYVNPAYCAMTGRSRGEVVGTTPREMQGPLTDRRVLERLRTDLRAGRPFSGETVNYRADGTPYIINWSIDPVRDARGVVTHYVATQEDVTAKVRAANLMQAQRHLDEALTRTLGSSLGDPEAVDRLVREITAAATSVAGVGSVAVSVCGPGHRSIDVGERRVDAAGAVATFPFGGLLDSLHGRIEVSAMSPDEAALLDRSGLTDLARRAGAVISALAEYQRQRRTALRLQHDLLPRLDVAVPGFTVVARYVPGADGVEVGGDWYDAVATDDEVIFSVGDVSDRGIEAAALMGRLRLLADVEFRRGAKPADVLRLLDEVCAREGQFATMLVVATSRTTGSTSVWSAGHLPPILGAAAGPRLAAIDPAPPLGHLRSAPLRPTSIDWRRGETLLAFTDGLVERRDESLDRGLSRLLEMIEPGADPAHVVDRMLSQRDGDLTDDVAVLGLRRNR